MDNKDCISDDQSDCNELNTSVPSFNKREIFKHLNQSGCSEESLHTVLSRFKLSKKTSVDYLNEMLRRSEKYLHQECSSFCFDNIQEWLLVLKKNNSLCPLEAFAEYLTELLNVEELPTAEELNGLDLRAAYKFITNGLLGLPQPMVNEETADFIVEEVLNLIEAVNNTEGDDAAYSMYDKLEEVNCADTDPNLIKLDPFQLG